MIMMINTKYVNFSFWYNSGSENKLPIPVEFKVLSIILYFISGAKKENITKINIEDKKKLLLFFCNF